VRASHGVLLATRKQLLRHLGYQRHVTQADRDTNLSQIQTFTLSDQNRAVYIMQSPVLQSWLNVPESSVLLINGNMSHSSMHHTPISFVSAKLADALHQSSTPALMNLHFFCGEHDGWRENPDDGPAAVWNSLLAQLLLQYDQFNFEELEQMSQLETSDVAALGRAFERCLRKLPRGSLMFCIVDSVALYDDDRRDEAELLVARLIRLVRVSADRGFVFKVLLTAATRLDLDAVDSLDEESEVLHVPDRLNSGNGFSDLEWEVGVGQDITDL
jgi:hypothetical protein